MYGNIDKATIALEINPKTFIAPIIEQGDTFHALKNLISVLAGVIIAIDYEARPAEEAYGEPGQAWYRPAHEPRQPTDNERRMIASFVQAEEVLLHAAIKDSRYAHCRARGGETTGWYTYIYHRDPTSPSGVMLAAAGPAAKVDPLIRQYRNNSPLSPTEGLRSAVR